jgi:hypothetical protein
MQTSAAEQRFPHPPQFCESFASGLMHEPLLPTEQRVSAAQLFLHEPAPHALVPSHAMPHPPQLSGLIARSTHCPPHTVSPGRHAHLPVPSQYC